MYRVRSKDVAGHLKGNVAVCIIVEAVTEKRITM